MHTLTTPPSAHTIAPVREADALTELGRFFGLTDHSAVWDENGLMPMFSPYVDAVWHRLLDRPELYSRFCRHHADAVIGHREVTGHGRVGWITAYEETYGPLPEVWFAGPSGTVDTELLATYRSTGTVITSWDCSPLKEPSDGSDGGTAEPRPTHQPTRPQEKPDPGWG